MSTQAIGVEYIFSELQVVESCGSPANDPMVGCHAVAIRFDLGGAMRSTALLLDMRAATQLFVDLQRVLTEHKEIISDTETDSNSSGDS